MKIDLEVKLDFDDVLILPKRSVLKSRRDVDITRTFIMKHSGRSWTGVPIVAANMDTIGTFAMHKSLSKYQMMTAFHKFYTEEQHLAAWQSMSDREVELAWFSIGMREQDYRLFCDVQEKDNRIQNLCIDVPSAYLESFVDFLSKVREENPDLTIMAGNVCTPEMTEALVLAGADIVKVGIGPGCFVPGQQVLTENGLRNIEDIGIGEKVLTHTGKFKTVTNTFKFDDKKEIININGIKATPNHEFYVLHKKYREIVNNHNIQNYAEWIPAKDLSKDYLLLRHK